MNNLNTFQKNIIFDNCNILDNKYYNKYKDIFYNLDTQNINNNKNDLKKIAESYLFWLDRLPINKSDEFYDFKNKICIHGIKYLNYKINALNLRDEVNKILLELVNNNAFNNFYKKYKTSREEHVQKINNAEFLHEKTKLYNYNNPDPVDYLINQKMFRYKWELKIKERNKSMIKSSQSNPEINYLKFMYKNFPNNYGKDYLKVINENSDLLLNNMETKANDLIYNSNDSSKRKYEYDLINEKHRSKFKKVNL